MNVFKITKLKSGKYKIVLDDNVVVTYDDVIIKYNLLYKKQIDKKTLTEIKKETDYYDNYNKVLNYAMKKIRCSSEVKKTIDSLDIEDDKKKEIYIKLVNLNLVNDRIYTNCYINDRFILSKDSINKIRTDLLKNKIDIDIIDEELAKFDIDEYGKLKKIIVKKINSNKSYSSYKLKNKIVSEMVNLGYNYDDIISIYEKHSKDDYELLLKEYSKLYNKLSKKYKGNELVYKIKSSLYSKGFSYDDIKKEDL